MEGANLNHANLNGVSLIETTLRGAQLRDAILRGSTLYQADLTGADLRGADLRNLPGHATRVDVPMLLRARLDRTTKLPAEWAKDPRVRTALEKQGEAETHRHSGLG
ncbi:hypothetical protein AQJ43_35470 [Streptomyces avermitilis]|uniref:Pentapeptide repeat-containing protein n=1 Tax=Streptomyces avermitilis TaxID=33903 RepID=A0A4D4MCF2_STRAX|nr:MULTISPECIES: pentapeptide repeat-containing protein [Streptomyces]KUN49777.1 hypothetical protein AQJ43_35470 [Streptomyces avermitilis]MYS96184.1 hypothetical protein [Streptomyces sp. SID5469]OOV21644.1 hypothetical protein SM007_33060 [Streptomyces avermitilis]BBJ48026.1 hypothetical protein SAVMC3_06550 [Streptomyces avermitilis]GDY69611.1 hypothetical protein SAV14893_090040 [Streptomyces avermitilis]